ncbi:unnamed protein product [Moneuplotes crassus]|uniref:Uncharacterized protein n=1 Tax=Euplotes crassus TaxID=5936 RepID=A0AAD1Y953_EUPCR|nr:unnamed protein product [Moneuplotes crassus]
MGNNSCCWGTEPDTENEENLHHLRQKNHPVIKEEHIEGSPKQITSTHNSNFQGSQFKNNDAQKGESSNLLDSILTEKEKRELKANNLWQKFYNLDINSAKHREGWTLLKTGEKDIDIFINEKNPYSEKAPIYKIDWIPRSSFTLEEYLNAMQKDRALWDTKIDENCIIKLKNSDGWSLIHTKLKDINQELKGLKEKYPGLKVPEFKIKPKQFFDKRLEFEHNEGENNNFYLYTSHLSDEGIEEFKKIKNEEDSLASKLPQYNKSRPGLRKSSCEGAKDDEEGKYETGRTILNLQRICYDNVTKEVKEVIIFNQIDANLTEEQHKMAMKGLPQSLVNWVESLEAHLQKSKK